MVNSSNADVSDHPESYLENYQGLEQTTGTGHAGTGPGRLPPSSYWGRLAGQR